MSTETRLEPFIGAFAVTAEARADVGIDIEGGLREMARDMAIEHGAIGVAPGADVTWTEVTEGNLAWAQAVASAMLRPGDWVVRVRVYDRRPEGQGGR